jgi:hypothetical protein
MNGAFPLQQFPLRERESMYALLLLLFVTWIGMMFASLHDFSGVATGIRIVLQASFVLIVAVGAVQMKALARAREVIGAQPMPQALWRRWARACLVETTIAWALVGAAMSALLASPASHLPWAGAFALISSGLCLGALCTLARHSMVPKPLAWLANAVAVAGLLAALYFGAAGLLAWFVNLPLPVLAVLALTWPMLGHALAREWRGQPAFSPGRGAAPHKRRLSSLAGHILRYSPLDTAWARQSPALQSTIGSRIGWIGKILFFVFVLSDHLVPLRVGQQPDIRHLLSLGLLCLMMTEALAARDLHWRWLLTPGTWRTGRIASDIFAATLRLHYVTLAVLVLAYMLWSRLFNETSGAALFDTIAANVLVLAELAFAISVALVIRALPWPTIVSAVTAIAMLGIWAYYHWIAGYAAAWRGQTAGLMHALVLVAATYAILRVADRLWTKEKLMACARGGG